jgi:uncharacterized Rmd1/YagE family protein
MTSANSQGLFLQVVYNMLELARQQMEASHSVQLEWIVIYLVLICAVLGVVQCVGVFYWPHH